MQTNVRHMYIVYVENEGCSDQPVRRGMAATLDDADRILDAICIQGEGDWDYGYVMRGDEKVSRRYREYPMPPPPTDEAEPAKYVERLQRLCDGKLSDADIQQHFDRWESAFERQSEEEGS